MRPRFRTGPLRASSELLATIPRATLVAAIVRHATTQPEYDGQPISTRHEHEGRAFTLETPGDRQATAIRLG